MQLGMVGLGRMGGDMTRRLMGGGHEVVVYDRAAEAVERLVGEGAVGSSGIGDMAAKLAGPKVIWLMLPAGDVTETAVQEALGNLHAGDIVVDGANSNWQDSRRRAEVAALGAKLGRRPDVVAPELGRSRHGCEWLLARWDALAEALEAANALRGARVTGLLVDTSPRPQETGRKLAAAMGARYLPLPPADAATLSRAV